MRILVVATHIKLPASHGGSTHVRELVDHLGQHGETLLLARSDSHGDGIAPVAFWRGHPPLGLKHALSLLYLPKALKAARPFAPDVIYERGSSTGLGMLLSRALRIPMLTMVLDEHFSPLSLRHARRIIATNTDLVPAAYRHKAVKVGWGANAQRFRAGLDGSAARERFGLGDAPVVAYTGSFQDWHGLRYLVEAAALLRDRPIRYLLIGDGRRREETEALVRERRLTDRFVITGKVPYDEVPGLLAAADVCVAPFDPDAHPLSRREGFALDPLKVFEYLAMAKPTITIHADNIEALFSHGEHLALVPRRDPKALAAAVADFLDDPDAAGAMARRGHDLVVQEHTWAAHAAHLAELFHAMRSET